MTSSTKSLAIRYYDEIKVQYVSADKVENFVLRDNYDDYPVFVRRKNEETEEESLVAAQILDVGGISKILY